MGVNGKIVKCVIFWKRLAVERNGWKFGIRGATCRKCICRVLCISDSPVWGHSVHFVKFSILRFSKGYCSYSFHSISTKLYRKLVLGEDNTGYYFFLLICQISKLYGTLKITYLSYIASLKLGCFHLTKCWADLQGRWAICQKLKLLWHFEF